MKHKILKDRRISVDGINVLEFTKGEILINATPDQLDALGDCCELCGGDSLYTTDVLTPQQKAAKTRAEKKAKRQAELAAELDDELDDDLDLE